MMTRAPRPAANSCGISGAGSLPRSRTHAASVSPGQQRCAFGVVGISRQAGTRTYRGGRLARALTVIILMTIFKPVGVTRQAALPVSRAHWLQERSKFSGLSQGASIGRRGVWTIIDLRLQLIGAQVLELSTGVGSRFLARPGRQQPERQQGACESSQGTDGE